MHWTDGWPATNGSSSHLLAAPLSVLGAVTLLYLLVFFLLPNSPNWTGPLDPRSPPVLQPTIPPIGHVISLIRERAELYPRLYRQHRKPIVRLTMWPMDGKVYMINAPELIVAAMRSRDLVFGGAPLDFVGRAFALAGRHVRLANDHGFMARVNAVIHAALRGSDLRVMAQRGLDRIAGQLNGIGAGGAGGDGDGDDHGDADDGKQVEVPDVFTWLQNFLSVSVADALFGDENPLGPKGINNIFVLDEGLLPMALGLGRWLAPGALAARAELHAALRPFFLAQHHLQNASVSALVRKRCAVMQSTGAFPDEDLALSELTIAWVALVNTVPALFWLFVHVFDSTAPATVARVRAEVLALTTVRLDGDGDGRVATLDPTRLNERDTPFLMACYHETMRVYTALVGQRRVLVDTVIRDQAGREYLLEKGAAVQWPTGVAHTEPDYWGEDAAVFRPERWLPAEEAAQNGSLAEARAVSAAAAGPHKNPASSPPSSPAGLHPIFPFGGGKHVCPGRQFAKYEITAFVGALAVGFDVVGVQVPAARAPRLSSSFRRPVWQPGYSPGGRVTRREGWEGVRWNFACSAVA